MEVVLENPLILLHEKKISNLKEILPLLENVARGGRPFVVIAEEVEGEALATLVVNKLKGTLVSAATETELKEKKARVEDAAATCTERPSAEGYFRERLRPLPFFSPRPAQLSRVDEFGTHCHGHAQQGASAN